MLALDGSSKEYQETLCEPRGGALPFTAQDLLNRAWLASAVLRAKIEAPAILHAC